MKKKRREMKQLNFARSASLFLAGLLSLSQTGCNRIPVVAKFKARRGIEICMSHRAPTIHYAYIGENAVCGVVDAVGYRGLPGGLSPFVFHPKPLMIPAGVGGPDYEDYTLNRTPLEPRELKLNIATLVRDCHIPADWETRCQDLDRSGMGDPPAYCGMMKLRNVLVLTAYANG